MAKKKTARPKAAGDRRGVVMTLKGSPEWASWVRDLARHARTDASKLIDLALVEFAQAHGFDRDAPER